MRNGTLNTVIVAQKKQNKEVGTTKSEEMRIQEVVATGCINRVNHMKRLQLKAQGDIHVEKTSEDQVIPGSSTTRRT
jgi:hypothetical protein